MNDLLSGLERQNRILQLVARNRRIRVAEVCGTFEVSEATARRDLETLASQGRVQRVHGGAIALAQAPPELPVLQREGEQAGEKARIGRAAFALVQDGETVFLGSGSTVLEAARLLRTRSDLTVITNSLPVVNLFAGLGNIQVICLGGVMRGSELSFIGHITEQALAEVRADKVLLGIRAINLEQGLSNDYLQETMTDRAILKAGREVIVVADHSKFGRVAAALLAPLESVHTLVTDRDTPADFLDAVRERGLRVIVA